MKKRLLAAYLLMLSAGAFAQQNVGIGTNDPKSKLDINGGISVGTGYSGTTAAPTDGAIIKGTVGIGTPTPDPKAALDVTATDKGIYMPRLTAAQQATLGATLNTTHKGLMVFNTTANRAEFWDGTVWRPVGEGAGGAPTGAAGGDLTGSYPSPAVANSAINSAKILDGSVTGNDLQDNTINLTTKVNNVLPVGNGGTGVNTVTGIMQGNGGSPVTGITAASGSTYMRRNSANTAYEFGQINYGEIAGTPTGLPPTGAAGGDLTGTYPSPAITAGAVTSAKIADGTVASIDITDNSVSTTDILDGTITGTDIADGTVASADITDNSVSTTDILNGTIAAADLSSMGAGTNQSIIWNGTAWVPYSPATGTLTGTGTTNYLPKWTGATTLSGTSLVYDNGTNVGIGTTSPSQKLDVNGNLALAGKETINSSDSWLRLNPSNAYASGTYIPGFFRADGGIASGGIGSLGSGTIHANGQVRAPIFYDYDNTGYYSDPNGTSRLSTALFDRTTGAYNHATYGGIYAGDWQNLTNTAGQMNYVQVNDFNTGHSNYPSGLYPYGGVLSMRGDNHSLQLYASHTGDLAYKTQWNNDNYTGWRTIITSANVAAQVAGLGYIPNNGSGDYQIASNSASTSYSNASLELREHNFGGAGAASPRLSFHWGGVVASQISMESSGRIAIRNNPGTGYENLIAQNLYSAGSTNVSGGLFTQGTASTLYGANASIYANQSNANGGGIMVSDDGGFVDYNDGPVTFVGSTGLVIAGNNGAGSTNAFLRVKQMAGSGNRSVYADGNGTLKTYSTKDVAYVEDRTDRITDASNVGWRVIGAATNNLAVEAGDVITISMSTKFRWTGGSGGDHPYFGIYIQGCTTASTTDWYLYGAADDFPRNQSQEISENFVYVSPCTGNLNFSLYMDSNSAADDNAGTHDTIIIAERH